MKKARLMNGQGNETSPQNNHFGDRLSRMNQKPGKKNGTATIGAAGAAGYPGFFLFRFLLLKNIFEVL
jgi:hypothetical protein